MSAVLTYADLDKYSRFAIACVVCGYVDSLGSYAYAKRNEETTCSRCGGVCKLKIVPNCPCCCRDGLPSYIKSWPKIKKGPHVALYTRDGLRLYQRNLHESIVDHIYYKRDSIGGNIYYAEPYSGDMRRSSSPEAMMGDYMRYEVDFLRNIGYDVKVTTGDGLHNPSHTLRVAIVSPPNESKVLRVLRSSMRVLV